MTAAFQTTITVSGEAKLLEAFKLQVRALLVEESDLDNFQEQNVSGNLIYRFDVARGIPFPPFVMTSTAFPDLKIRVEWVNRRQQISGSVLIQNGKLTEHRTQGLTDHQQSAPEVLHGIEVAENGYLKLAIVCKAIGAEAYAGYLLTGKQQAVFKITRRGNSAELYASDGLEAEWAEHWTYNLESGQCRYQQLANREALPEKLSDEIEALVNDFLDEYVWFSESAPEDIIIERQKYERMGLAAHAANIKAEKIRKMTKGDSGRGNFYGFSTLGHDCAWIKAAIVECWAEQ